MARIGLYMGRPMSKWQMKIENQDVRDCREHELEDAEGNGRDTRTADGRLFEDTLETEVTCRSRQDG